MKSSTGEHWLALDHIRGVAALMVFCWHFVHAPAMPGLSDYGAPAIVPLALLDEGHMGVALFMTLSGYLFAKLLDGRAIDFRAFLWNRFLRLAPLLLVVVVIVGLIDAGRGVAPSDYLLRILGGLWLPTLPNGGWSITVEAHFYLLLPILLAVRRRWPLALAALLIPAILMRWSIYQQSGEIFSLSYWTIIGRIDQFLLGILAFEYRHLATWKIAAVATLSFTAFYWWFGSIGGYLVYGSGPMRSPAWIALPTIEAVAFGVVIAWYDTSFQPTNRGLSRLLGLAGAYSYSIYLLHWFWVHDAAALIHANVMDLSNFYVALAWAIICFGLMIPIGSLSFRLVEGPFLRFRKPYRLPRASAHD